MNPKVLFNFDYLGFSVNFVRNTKYFLSPLIMSTVCVRVYLLFLSSLTTDSAF